MQLPKDLPARDKLIEAGFGNYNVLRNHKPLWSIRGLTQKEAKDIQDYLSGDYKPKKKKKNKK
jgi:hypothetical protein